MDAPVVAAIVSSSVAVLVAVGSAIRADLQRASDRRYERRRAFLVDAQNAVLALRDALSEYGAAAVVGADDDIVAGLDRVRRVASGQLAVAASRLEDAAVSSALKAWEVTARTALVDPLESSQAGEERAFADFNSAAAAALRSARGVSTRR